MMYVALKITDHKQPTSVENEMYGSTRPQKYPENMLTMWWENCNYMPRCPYASEKELRQWAVDWKKAKCLLKYIFLFMFALFVVVN